MQYMLLLAQSEDAANDPDGPVSADWTAYTQALAEAGILRGGAGLEGVHTATTVRVRDGERLITDGPFAEAKEHVLGFYLVETPDLDTALDWAAKVPNVLTGSVEVRPVMAGPAEHGVDEQALAAAAR